jgi:hypothetical protein
VIPVKIRARKKGNFDSSAGESKGKNSGVEKSI